MSKATQLLESAVADVIANRSAENGRPNARNRAALDRAFRQVMTIIAPRVRHFIRQYGLAGHWDDAWQTCAIGVHRAIEAYDPGKAMFTTFVNWQIRGELQALRFRLMDDQRSSAKKVGATTISLQAVERGAQGDDLPIEAMIEDEGALDLAEGGAAEYMSARMCDALIDEYVRHLRALGLARLRRGAPGSGLSGRSARHRAGPTADTDEIRRLEERIARDCGIVRRHLFGTSEAVADDADRDLTRERIRQITRRAARVMGELASGNPRFGGGNRHDLDASSPAEGEFGEDADARHGTARA